MPASAGPQLAFVQSTNAQRLARQSAFEVPVPHVGWLKESQSFFRAAMSARNFSTSFALIAAEGQRSLHIEPLTFSSATAAQSESAAQLWS